MATPAREQYLALKAQHPDAVLWFRMGDFYELFDDDAQLVARELHLTLTSREFGRGERVPMAGVPHHAAESYLAHVLARMQAYYASRWHHTLRRKRAYRSDE